MNNVATNKAWIDYARALAALCVVVLHASTPVVHGFNHLPQASWWAGNVYDDKNMVKLMKKDTTLTPYKKSGININFLNFDKLDDKGIKSLEKAKSNELVQLIKKRTEIKKQKGDQLQTLIDSITKIVDAKKEWWEAKIVLAKNAKMDKILQSHLKNVDIWIDTWHVPLNQCYYFIHPHFNEKGLRCFFNTDSISQGMHQFKFYRNFLDKNDDLTRDSIYLPILKH